jgi:hypothetical protein
MRRSLDEPPGSHTSTRQLEELLMIIHILEGVGVLYLIAMVSLLIGLLRSAKASSQVTEEQQDRLAEKDMERLEEQKKQKGLSKLLSAS